MLNHDILVIIAEIFRRSMSKGLARPEQFSVLVLDECHHCIGQHPYNAMLNDTVHCADSRPRIVGLTASYLHGRMTSE